MENGAYKLTKNGEYGRYLAANKFIRQGELILNETPVIVGPQVGGPAVCFRCCASLKKSYGFCGGCEVALICSPKCTGGFHGDPECQALRDADVKGDDLVSNCEVITPFRCLLLRTYDEDLWKRFIQLESHADSRRDTPIWRRHRSTVEEPLQQLGYLNEDHLRKDIVQRVCGILDVNSFEVRSPQSSKQGAECLRGVYPTAACMPHSCMPNTHLAVDEDFVLTVHAATDILEGQPIYFNYANSMQGRADRMEYLKEGKYFICDCPRCLDNTELDTEMSSLICPRCREGTVRQDLSDEKGCFWECSRCQLNYPGYLVRSTINEARRRVQEIESPEIVDMERLVKKFSLTFHPHHYVILEIEQDLVRWYGHSVQNRKNMCRKIQLCCKLLEIARKVEPGISRIQAITLYELHTAQVNLAQKEYNNQDIREQDFIERLLSAEVTLKEAIKLLLYEPRKSPEGRLAQSALAELKNLRLSIRNIQRTFLEKPAGLKGRIKKRR